MVVPPVPGSLARRLGVADAVVIGLGSMIGAGVFAAFAPAAKAAGSGLLIGLAVAAIVAYCNATSSSRLAALYPESGGTYVYGRRRLGDFWGYQAGWAFVVGKTASCAAMALTFASYAAPGHIRIVGVLAVIALTAVNYRGVQKSAWLTRLIVALTLLTLAVVVIASLAGGHADAHHLTPFPGTGVRGVLQAGGLLFFAFAGYARIATLGEEVRDPGRTIPRAVTIALLIALVVYAIVAVAALLAAGPDGLAATRAPLRAAVAGGRLQALAPLVQIGGAIAALGSLLALILGVSRTTFAMARDRHLPTALAAVHPRYGVPHRAELAVGAVVVVLVATIDLRCDRVLLVRCSRLLRDRQRLRDDADARGEAAATMVTGGRAFRLPHTGVQPAGSIDFRRRRRAVTRSDSVDRSTQCPRRSRPTREPLDSWPQPTMSGEETRHHRRLREDNRTSVTGRRRQ